MPCYVQWISCNFKYPLLFFYFFQTNKNKMRERERINMKCNIVCFSLFLCVDKENKNKKILTTFSWHILVSHIFFFRNTFFFKLRFCENTKIQKKNRIGCVECAFFCVFLLYLTHAHHIYTHTHTNIQKYK